MEADEKLSELEGKRREQVVAYVSRRWSQLSTADGSSRQNAAKFVALINAGGAAGVLAFMGAIADKPSIVHSLPLRATLVLFVVGVVFSAFGLIATNLRISGLFNDWRRDVGRFYNGEIGFNRLQREDTRRAEEPEPAVFCLWVSLVVFVAATVTGLYALIN